MKLHVATLAVFILGFGACTEAKFTTTRRGAAEATFGSELPSIDPNATPSPSTDLLTSPSPSDPGETLDPIGSVITSSPSPTTSGLPTVSPSIQALPTASGTLLSQCTQNIAVVNPNAIGVFTEQPLKDTLLYQLPPYMMIGLDFVKGCPSYDGNIAHLVCQLNGFRGVDANGISFRQWTSPSNNYVYFWKNGAFEYHNAKEYNYCLSYVRCKGQLAQICVDNNRWIPGVNWN